MTDDDDPKPAPPIADRSLDRIADEAMEQADAEMKQAQASEEKKRRNIAIGFYSS